MKVLFTTWEGGGHVPPALVVAARMASQGAEVLMVSDEATRRAAVAAGLRFTPWTRAPNRSAGGLRDDPLDDWRAATPLGVVRAVCDSVMCAPAAAYAADALALIEAERPDIVVSNELLLGVMAAAERTATPLALLTGNLWCFPTRDDLPPFGPAFPPARTTFQRRREAGARRMIHRLYDMGLRDLNRARGELGLPPLRHTLDQLRAATLTVLGTARAFDYEAEPPEGVIYAGPLAPPPVWAAGGSGEAVQEGEGPLVLVSFSTTYQGEEKIMARCIEALGRMPVRGLVTLGPALEDARLPRRPNVRVVKQASHDEIVPLCAAVVCHGGHGTVIRPLIHGVPIVCIPTGRDQPENARRVVERGAGRILPRRSSVRRIEEAVGDVLADPGYAAAARRLGASIAAEADGGVRAARAIAGLVRPSA